MAIPLSVVARLEEFPRASLEIAGGQAMVQYRGQIMPIINVATLLADERPNAGTRRVKKEQGGNEAIQVVVYTHESRNVGLRVERILDIVQQRVELQTAASRPALGTAIIKEKVTELLDVQAIVRRALNRRRAKRRELKEHMTDAKQYCSFFVDRLFFGVDVREVQEVIRYQEMTRVPEAAGEVAGLINLKGQIVTAIDLRRRLNLPGIPAGKLPMNVVIRTDDAAVSLLVDEIGDVLQVDSETYEPAPETLTGTTRELVLGVHKLKDRLLLLLDTQKTVAVG